MADLKLRAWTPHESLDGVPRTFRPYSLAGIQSIRWHGSPAHDSLPFPLPSTSLSTPLLSLIPQASRNNPIFSNPRLLLFCFQSPFSLRVSHTSTYLNPRFEGIFDFPLLNPQLLWKKRSSLTPPLGRFLVREAHRGTKEGRVILSADPWITNLLPRATTRFSLTADRTIIETRAGL